jgi:hypothetical protein
VTKIFEEGIMKNYFLIMLSAFLLISCGVNEEEYNKVVAENKELKERIEELENGAPRLLGEVKKYYSSKDYSNVKRNFEKIKEQHFGTPEYEESLKIYEIVVKIEKEEKAKIQREKEQKEKERLASLSKLKKQVDDVSGITWYTNPYFTHYNNSNNLSIYIGKEKTGEPWLRLKMSYQGSDWIFFERAYISYEGNTVEIKFDEYRDKKSDNDSGVWEWIDVRVTSDILKFLEDFAQSQDAKMRLSGKYTKTRNLTKNERQGIIAVLNGYDVLR